MNKERLDTYSFTESSNFEVYMIKETKRGSVVIKNHFKSSTHEEIDFKLANILAELLNKELNTVKQDKNTL